MDLKRRFFDSCKTQDLDTLRDLIHQGPPVDIDWADQEGNTGLHHAAQRDFRDVTILLLNLQANPNIRNREGCTPLILACINSHLEIMQILLHHEAVDCNVRDNFDCTALWWIAHGGNLGALEIFMRAQKPFDITSPGKVSLTGDSLTPREIAARKGYFRIIQTLSRPVAV